MRQTFLYNNMMYVGAGYVEELVSGKTWETLVSDRILGPLGMKSTVFTIDDMIAEDDKVATRKASSQVIQWAASKVPQLISGSADLEPSTLTEIEGGGSVTREDYSGRNVHYGVREHGMGAIVNGLNLHGLRAFSSTFFTFSDYMKGAVRLAAVMGIPSIFVYTHDSIGLGEDGPTHQPIEQLASLRAMPGLIVLRPGDANEVAEAWRLIMELKHDPTVLVVSRQAMRTLGYRTQADPALRLDAPATFPHALTDARLLTFKLLVTLEILLAKTDGQLKVPTVNAAISVDRARADAEHTLPNR